MKLSVPFGISRRTSRYFQWYFQCVIKFLYDPCGTFSARITRWVPSSQRIVALTGSLLSGMPLLEDWKEIYFRTAFRPHGVPYWEDSTSLASIPTGGASGADLCAPFKISTCRSQLPFPASGWRSSSHTIDVIYDPWNNPLNCLL